MSALILTTEFLVLLITSIQAFQYGMPMNNLANIFYNGYPQSMYPVYPQQPLTAATPMTWPTSARQEQVVMPSPTSKIPINVEDVELNVRHLITLNYQKRTYVMVENLTLPFTEAENFCVKKFCEEMHLASVHTNEEWAAISNAFARFTSNDIWLGGTMSKPKPNEFALKWTDNKPFDYQRFEPKERERWRSFSTLTNRGCIRASLEHSQHGNWSVDSAPCLEPRRFVCLLTSGTDTKQLKKCDTGQADRMDTVSDLLELMLNSPVGARTSGNSNTVAKLPSLTSPSPQPVNDTKKPSAPAETTTTIVTTTKTATITTAINNPEKQTTGVKVTNENTTTTPKDSIVISTTIPPTNITTAGISQNPVQSMSASEAKPNITTNGTSSTTSEK